MITRKSYIHFVILIFILILTISSLSFAEISNENATAYSYTISEDGVWVRTQDAYLVGNILFKDLNLKSPEDIFIRNEKIYIAEGGNGQIVIVDINNSNNINYVGKGILNMPTGVFVDEKDRILVADYGLGEVVMFDSNGELLRRYKRPESIVFGQKANYNPRKVVSDKMGNVYIVSEGTYDGIIQLSEDGEFLGYFGANITYLSFGEALLNLIFTKEQQAQLFNIIPKTFYNLAIDDEGLIYTITQGVGRNAIKKHNVSGNNILKQANRMISEPNFVDITVGNYNQIYALTETGLIYEYDSEGNLIYSFGGRAISTERNGFFTVPVGIAVDQNDNVYVLDKERGIVHVFYPTAITNMTHEAISLYEKGKYIESMSYWQEILKLSGRSRIAHNGLGKAYFQSQDYEKAAEHFKIANNKIDYSEAYWEIRNLWLQNNIATILIVVFLVWVLWQIVKLLDKKYGILNVFRNFFRKTKEVKLVSDVLYMGRFMLHPIDSSYDIKHGKKASVMSATLVYVLAFIAFVLDYLFKGFIFNPRDFREVSYLYVIMIFGLPLALWVVSNYLVSTLNDGEGKFRDVYCTTSYALAPLVLFMPIVTLLSYVITLNEGFIIQFASVAIWVWCGVLIFVSLKEIHNFSVGGVIKNILLTLFLMFIFVIAYFIVYMLGSETFNFIYTLVKEAAYRIG